MPVYERSAGVWRVVAWVDGTQHERVVRGSRFEAECVEAALRDGPGRVPARSRRLAAWARWRCVAAERAVVVSSWPQVGGVYVIQAGQDGPMKIGIAESIRLRLVSIQTCNPSEIRLVAYLPGGTRADECGLHARFAHLRIRGEWFHATAELCDFVARVASETAAA